MIVLDASAAADVILNTEPRANRIRERMENSEGGTHVPHLFEIEVLHALRRNFLFGNLTERRVHIALNRLSTMELTRYPHTPFIERIWELRNITPYDAAYIASPKPSTRPS